MPGERPRHAGCADFGGTNAIPVAPRGGPPAALAAACLCWPRHALPTVARAAQEVGHVDGPVARARSRSCRPPFSPASWAPALLSAIWLIRERARISSDNATLRARIADLNAAPAACQGLLNLRDQRIVVWASDKSKPEVIGTLPAVGGAPEDRSGFLAFGRWLMPRSAAALEQAVTALREKWTGFDLVDRDA